MSCAWALEPITNIEHAIIGTLKFINCVSPRDVLGFVVQTSSCIVTSQYA